jgi:hypothetical protein
MKSIQKTKIHGHELITDIIVGMTEEDDLDHCPCCGREKLERYLLCFNCFDEAEDKQSLMAAIKQAIVNAGGKWSRKNSFHEKKVTGLFL